MSETAEAEPTLSVAEILELQRTIAAATALLKPLGTEGKLAGDVNDRGDQVRTGATSQDRSA